MAEQHINGVYSLTLRTADGREQTLIAFIPNDNVRNYYIDKAHKNGLEIEFRSINTTKNKQQL